MNSGHMKRLRYANLRAKLLLVCRPVDDEFAIRRKMISIEEAMLTYSVHDTRFDRSVHVGDESKWLDRTMRALYGGTMSTCQPVTDNIGLPTHDLHHKQPGWHGVFLIYSLLIQTEMWQKLRAMLVDNFWLHLRALPKTVTINVLFSNVTEEYL